ncbi:MAG: nucleotidyltransferase family protein [Christensenellaceae bacterium]|jgi:NDP-sugar pyrophosphorylase family protein
MAKKTLAVLAAGLGARYGGIKQIAPVGPNGETLLHYAIFDALEAGFEKIVFIIKRDIEADFKEVIGRPTEAKCEVAYAYQDEAYLPSFYEKPAARTKMLGTVQAMLAAEPYIDGPFAIINADDYYGKDAYLHMAEKLSALQCENGVHTAAMVGYALQNTISKNGNVNRGVCQMQDGVLLSMHETYDIAVFPDGTIRSTRAGADTAPLDPASVVSMNFFGFDKAIFGSAKKYFDAFLANLAPGDLTSEYPLPTMIDDMMQDGILQMSVIPSNSIWLGITYPEDRAYVHKELIQLSGKGLYPAVIK